MVGSISSFIAFILTCLIVLLTITSATSNWQVFVNSASILIVLGGTLVSEFIARGFRETLGSLVYMLKIMFKQPMKTRHLIREIDTIKSWADRIQSGGKKVYDEIYSEVTEPFEKYVFSILSTGYSVEESKEFIQNEIQRELEINERRAEILSSLGGSAPAFGMLGTLIGLVILLSQLDDPSKIGPAMAVALITTFYGLILARVFFIPGANKSTAISDSTMFRKQMILEGVSLIMQEKSSFYVEDYLSSFVEKNVKKEDISSDSSI